MVRVLDEDGHEVLRGYYMRHENRQPGCCEGLRDALPSATATGRWRSVA